MKFKEKLRDARARLGYSQREMAEFIGMNASTYGNYEERDIPETSAGAQKIIASGVIDSQQMSKDDDYRITDIPDFYKRLNSVCDKNGKINVHKNHPTLVALRGDLGAPKHLMDRVEFGEELKKQRLEKGLTMKEAAELVGIKMGTYANYEYRLINARSEVYNRIISSPLFEEEGN